MNASRYEKLVAAIAEDDAAGIGSVLAPSVRLRAIAPSGVYEEQGPDAVAARIRRWFAGHERIVTTSEIGPMGDRVALSYRLRLTREGSAWNLEQHAFCDEGPDGIERIDLVCSGYRPVVTEDPDGAFRYDAGGMACTDGLDEQFKRAIRSIPVGSALRVVARDASAEVELPSFARLLGHEVEEVSPGDGMVTVQVRRNR